MLIRFNDPSSNTEKNDHENIVALSDEGRQVYTICTESDEYQLCIAGPGKTIIGIFIQQSLRLYNAADGKQTKTIEFNCQRLGTDNIVFGGTGTTAGTCSIAFGEIYNWCNLCVGIIDFRNIWIQVQYSLIISMIAEIKFNHVYMILATGTWTPFTSWKPYIQSDRFFCIRGVGQPQIGPHLIRSTVK